MQERSSFILCVTYSLIITQFFKVNLTFVYKSKVISNEAKEMKYKYIGQKLRQN